MVLQLLAQEMGNALTVLFGSNPVPDSYTYHSETMYEDNKWKLCAWVDLFRSYSVKKHIEKTKLRRAHRPKQNAVMSYRPNWMPKLKVPTSHGCNVSKVSGHSKLSETKIHTDTLHRLAAPKHNPTTVTVPSSKMHVWAPATCHGNSRESHALIIFVPERPPGRPKKDAPPVVIWSPLHRDRSRWVRLPHEGMSTNKRREHSVQRYIAQSRCYYSARSSIWCLFKSTD